jgi:hypothetical protein
VDFAASSSTLTVAGRVLEVFPSRAIDSGKPETNDPRGLGLSFRALAARGIRCPPAAEATGDPQILLSWPCPLAPPRRAPAGASTPSTRPPKRSCAFGSGLPTPDILFRPRGFTPPRRLPPHQGRGSVAPHSRPRGSPRFGPAPVHHRPGPRSETPWTGSHLPAAWVPFEGFPSSAAVPHHCDPLPSCRCLSPDSPKGRAPPHIHR